MHTKNKFCTRKMLASLLAGCVAASLGGCAVQQKSVNIKGNAGQVLNRDASGNSLSVAVRLYQLKGPEEFSRLTLDMLANAQSDVELTGPELLEKTEAILVPGGDFSQSVILREDTKLVGVVAFFRQPDPHYWRFLVDADKVRREGLDFSAKDCYLVLRNPKPVLIPGQPAEVPPQCDRGRVVDVGTVPAPKRPLVQGKPTTVTTTSKR